MADGTSGPGPEGQQTITPAQAADRLPVAGDGRQVDKAGLIALRNSPKKTMSSNEEGRADAAGTPDVREEIADVKKMFQKWMEQYQNGNEASILEFLVPNSNEAQLEAAKNALDNTINNNLTNKTVRDEMINKWAESGTSRETAAFFIENTVQEPAIKAEMSEEIEKRLQPMSVEEEKVQFEVMQQLATEALKGIPEEQRAYYQGKLEKLQDKFGKFFSRETTSGTVMRGFGKGVGWTLVLSLIALVVGMHLIGKLQTGQGRR